jgi:dethiobiotin synthetase
MAAEHLGRPGFTVDELEAELVWPIAPVNLGLVESAGGVCSPQANDGDVVGLVRALGPDAVLLVADAGLGMINAIRLSMGALVKGSGGLAVSDVVVVLNRFDESDQLHVRNRQWLADRDGLRVLVTPGQVSVLAAVLTNR